MKQSNEKLDVKAGEAARQGIIQMIEKGINNKYFKEARLEPFFEHCFALAEPHKLMEEPRFKEFCYTDLKYIF